MSEARNGSPRSRCATGCPTTPVQAEDYKLLPPDIERVEDIDWSRGVTINDLPVNSAICEPAAHAHLSAGRLSVRGWAMATARNVVRVDVSSDGGRSWRQAELEPRRSPWSWTLWAIEADLGVGEHQLVVRAWDSAGQTQPSTPDETWNVKGYLRAALASHPGRGRVMGGAQCPSTTPQLRSE